MYHCHYFDYGSKSSHVYCFSISIATYGQFCKILFADNLPVEIDHNEFQIFVFMQDSNYSYLLETLLSY